MASGRRRLIFTSPTGGGKSYCINQMLKWGMPALVLCNRTMLMEQLARGMDAHGVPYGIQASGYAPSIFENVQLGMMQTVSKRWAEGRIELPPADLVFIDEIHNETGGRSQKILEHYYDRGATTVGVTATPIGVGHLGDELIVAGRNSELRSCGALVPAKTFAPDELDARCFKGTAKGILQIRDEVKEVVLKVVFGRVIEHYFKINPDQRPAILFAPGVAESRWFAEQFCNAGVTWSHIDGELIILNGVEMPANAENRAKLMEAHRKGETRGISNRFVLREGIDAPWIYHCIFACKFGSLTSYLQAGGRVLRNYEGLDHVVVSDHGGNHHLWDSLNCDREWSLEDTEKSVKEKRLDALREKKEAEPIVCPSCSKVRTQGATCPHCGFAYRGNRRVVIQTDGTLKQVYGDVYKPRRVSEIPEDQKKWASVFWRCYKTGKTFNQARGLFLHLTGCVPGSDWPLVPIHSSDWTQTMDTVPFNRLNSGRVAPSMTG